MKIRQTLTVAVVALSALLLSGCASAPTQEEIQERFAIEAAATYDDDVDSPRIQKLAEGLADGAAEDCKNEQLWTVATSGLSDVTWDKSLQRIWASSCTVLFDDLPKSLADDYKEVIIDSAMESVTEK